MIATPPELTATSPAVVRPRLRRSALLLAGLADFGIAVFVADRDGLVLRDGADGHAPSR